MKILPPQTKPPTSPIERRHRPRPVTGRQGYLQFRPCLRWDFGFTCPFCLLHESDFVRGGCAEGTGLTWIEHLVPQSQDPAQNNEYSNLLYSCRFCNRARSNRPLKSARGEILNPTQTAWAKHFELQGDELKPKTGDNDATYTHECYDLDEPRKKKLRQLRREVIEHHRELLRVVPKMVIRKIQLAEQNPTDPLAVRQNLDEAQCLRRILMNAISDLRTHSAIPGDADQECLCDTQEYNALPVCLAQQSWEMDSDLQASDG
jgi:5-methylcytosine-specific restriction endonuclease McrA